MGYYANRDIVNVKEPFQLTLSGTPSFIQFSDVQDGGETGYLTGNMTVVKTDFAKVEELESYTTITIRENTNKQVYTIKGTYNQAKIDDSTFFVARAGTLFGKHLLTLNESAQLTAQNLRECLMNLPFFRNKFNLKIRTSYSEGLISPSTIIDLEARGTGAQYKFTVGANPEFLSCSDSISDLTASLSPRKRYSLTVVNSDLKDEDVEPQDSSKENMTGQVIWINDNRVQETVCTHGSAGLLHPDANYEPGYLLTRPNGIISAHDANCMNAESVMNKLLENSFISKNMEVTLEESSISLSFKEGISPDRYEVYILTHPIYMSAITTTDDPVDNGSGNSRISLDVFSDTGLFLGAESGSISENINRGTYMTSLSKSYPGSSVWFELNTLIGKKAGYSSAFLNKLESDDADVKPKDWVDAGTLTDYQIIAKYFDGCSYMPVYYTTPRYVLNGYAYTLEPDDMDEYVVDLTARKDEREQLPKMKPLTTCLSRTHVVGQHHYFNFILKNSGRPALAVKPPSLALCYKMYTRSGVLIGSETGKQTAGADLNIVNTGLIRLDDYLPTYKDCRVGRIDVYLCGVYPSLPTELISAPLSFKILPECLHTVNDFAFLNRLGGWDSFNFGGSESSEFKTAPVSIYRTLRPDFSLHTEIESVAFKTVQEQKTVRTSPISYQTVEWSRELSASPAVYELSTKRYVIVSEMTLKYNSQDDLYQIDMKYRYSDTFNSRQK